MISIYSNLKYFTTNFVARCVVFLFFIALVTGKGIGTMAWGKFSCTQAPSLRGPHSDLGNPDVTVSIIKFVNIPSYLRFKVLMVV